MIGKRLEKSFPLLKISLAQANMVVKVGDYIDSCLKKSLIFSILINLLMGIFLWKFNKTLSILILSFPVILITVFFYLIKIPKAKIKKKINEVDKEVIYAGRFLLVELSAGVPLFESIRNVSKSYEHIGKHFAEILERIELGVPINKAIEEVIEITPSDNFRKILWQINNSLKTGADVTVALKAIIDQISREQLIAIQNYAKKLNPLIMFYLIIAVIFPSLGITMLALLGGFIGGIELVFLKAEPPFFGTLFIICLFVIFLQFMFLSIIKSSRPGVEIG